LPIEGANDGASGAAVVLELARVFQEKPTTHGLVFALCDGEDLGSLKAPKDWCLGSKHLAERLEPAWGVRLAINVDMVGDRHLAFTRELYGQRACPQFSDFCWSVGQEIAPEAFGGGSSRPVFDDHASFLRVGIPSFDLIDFDYEGWHTQGDVIERCSARSLQTAGRVVEAILRRLETENWAFCVGPLPADMNRY
jgi:Zn-dependent M28 family amino/carboxypeptidase